MAVKTLNEYQITGQGLAPQLIAAEKMSDALAIVEGAAGTVLFTEAVLKQFGLKVNVPEPDVLFEVQVSPAPAATAGCVALPSAYKVPVGTKVIMQAVIPASTNYTFAGWYRGVTLLSANMIAEITIEAPLAGATSDVIVATFTPPVTP